MWLSDAKDDAVPDEGPTDSWESQARILRTIAHPVRLAILETLCEGPRCVNDINQITPIPQAQLSQHMAALRKMELISFHINGPLRCYYILKPTLVKKLIRILRQEHPAKERERKIVIREAKHRNKTSPPESH